MTLQDFLIKGQKIELENCPKFIKEQLPKDTLNKCISKHLVDIYEYTKNIDFATKNYKYCKKAVPNSKPKDYLFRNLETPFGILVSSIRYMGGDLTKPFVFIVLKNFEINSIEKIEWLSSFLNEEYKVFSPKRIAWHTNKIQEDFINNHSFINGDMVYVAEFLDYLKTEKIIVSDRKIKLKIAENTNWYKQYKTAYNLLFEKDNFYNEMIQITTEATFKEMIQHKTLFEIVIDNEWAGIIGVMPENDKYLSGYCVYEEFLLEKFRGKGMAKHIQQKMIHLLPSSPNKMVYGTIHYNNKSSLKTALGVGRKVCEMIILADVK